MNLGYSRMQYFEFTTDVSTENVIKMHMNAFRYTGGIPSEILFDNMKQIVIDRKIKASESRFNETFLRFSEHYGLNIRLCFPYSPRSSLWWWPQHHLGCRNIPIANWDIRCRNSSKICHQWRSQHNYICIVHNRWCSGWIDR